MSMIGVLIDNLNKSADEWNSSNMFELAHMCRDAADTIWQLRDDLQRANTEKAALERRIDELCAEVERLRKAKDTMHGDAFEIGAMLVKARDENAKLRKLASDMWKAISTHKRINFAQLLRFGERMSELGIEVSA